jgi:RimJ/RimL family protein N-acetyltransferase
VPESTSNPDDLLPTDILRRVQENRARYVVDKLRERGINARLAWTGLATSCWTGRIPRCREDLMTELARFDTIRTDRLLMRRWLESDRAPFAALNGEPETMRFFPSTLDRAASDAFADRIESLFEKQGYGLWALDISETDKFIGYTGLNPMPADVPGAGGVEIQWRLAKHAWHQGYATEAATAALGVAFDGAGLDEIWSMTAVLNEPPWP